MFLLLQILRYKFNKIAETEYISGYITKGSETILIKCWYFGG